MAKKEKEPKYVMSELNTPMINYKRYVMNIQEILINYVGIFIVGGLLGLIFYGNQFLDENGAATNLTMIFNIVTFLVAGLLIMLVMVPVREKSLIEKRRSKLVLEFRSFLDAIAIALSSGMNMSDALLSIYDSLSSEYTDDAMIVQETREMINGVQNNVRIEDMLVSLGERSDIEDIKNFGIVFATCYRVGGDMKSIVQRTNSILSEKLEAAAEIETTLASNKLQFGNDVYTGSSGGDAEIYELVICKKLLYSSRDYS